MKYASFSPHISSACHVLPEMNFAPGNPKQDAWFTAVVLRTDQVNKVGCAAFFTAVLQLFWPESGESGHNLEHAGVALKLAEDDSRTMVRFRLGAFMARLSAFCTHPP